MSLSTSLIIEKPSALQGQSACSLFASVQHLPWASLLDTCNNKLSDGRYDILVAHPVSTIKSKNHKLTVATNNLSQENQQCPFDTLEQALDEFKSLISNNDFMLLGVENTEVERLPFLVGALGYFGYDLNTQLDDIINSDDQSERAEYLADDFAVGIYDESIIIDNRTQEVYYCHLGEQKLLERILKYLSHKSDIANDLSNDTNSAVKTGGYNEASQNFALKSQWQSNVSKLTYIQNIQRIHEYLLSGDCYQVNYAQQFTSQYEGSEWHAYCYLRERNQAPFSSFIRHADFSILSMSPERFLQVKNGIVETKPIKGTRARSQDPIEDKRLSEALISSEKDRAENLMIVDLLRNDLSKHCQANSVKVPALFKLESYPAVHHMVSTVVGKIAPQSSPVTLLKGAFPGGSITGAPKVRAMQVIQELEGSKRAIYCGSIGYIGIRGDMDTSICIRTLLAENGTLYCWAGGGIVLDSVAEDEYQESYDKVAKILTPLSKQFGQGT